VALKGFHKWFLKQSNEEREHAQKLIKYQNKRGGRLVMEAVEEPPARSNWGTPLLAMQFALFLEKKVNQVNIPFHNVLPVHYGSLNPYTLQSTMQFENIHILFYTNTVFFYYYYYFKELLIFFFFFSSSHI
jgi:hypothetical protein